MLHLARSAKLCARHFSLHEIASTLFNENRKHKEKDRVFRVQPLFAMANTSPSLRVVLQFIGIAATDVEHSKCDPILRCRRREWGTGGDENFLERHPLESELNSDEIISGLIGLKLHLFEIKQSI